MIDQLTHSSFDPSAYKDQVKGRVRKLLAELVKTGEVIQAPVAGPPSRFVIRTEATALAC